MATRQYLHAEYYNRSFFGGSYNQGSPMTIMYSMDYNPNTGMYIAVGRFDADLPNVPLAFRYSYDGINWTQCTLSGGNFPLGSTTIIMNEVRWLNNSLWVAGDDLGSIYTSTDGIDWTLRYTDPNARFVERIRYGNGRYVAVGDTDGTGGLIVTSTDGITWTPTANTVDSNIIGLDYSAAQSKFIAVGGSGNVWTVTDPTATWTPTAVGTTPRYFVYWDADNSLWIASGSGGLLETSTTGATWTSRTITGLSAQLWCIEKTSSGTLMVCGQLGQIAKSTNATTWTLVSPTPTPVPDTVNNYYALVAGPSGEMYVTGSNAFTYKTTNDGATWSVVGSYLTTTTPTPSVVSEYDMTASYLKLMNTTIGTAQASSVWVSADISTIQYLLLGEFASYPLDSAQTVGGGTMTLNVAQNASASAAAFQVTSFNVYVWRPSTSTKVGTVRDGSAAPLGGAAGGTAITVQNITGITTSAVNAQAGDIIVCEIWAAFTQGMNTSYTCTWYYDGTTVNTTQGATVTNHASFIEFTENLTFSTTPVPTGGGVKSRSFFTFFN